MTPHRFTRVAAVTVFVLTGLVAVPTVAHADLTCEEGDELVETSGFPERGRFSQARRADRDDDGFVCEEGRFTAGGGRLRYFYYDDI